MKIVLRENVDKLGQRGEVVTVANGYARNYLLPQRLAFLATEENLRRVDKEKKVLEIKRIQERDAAQALADRLGGVSCTIVKKAGEEETLYGSVTTAEIAAALEKEGIVIDKRKIRMDDPIKALGIYTIPVHIHPEVAGEVKVWVVKE
jgi:large subunit ribosomal protein L9